MQWVINSVCLKATHVTCSPQLTFMLLELIMRLEPCDHANPAKAPAPTAKSAQIWMLLLVLPIMWVVKHKHVFVFHRLHKHDEVLRYNWKEVGHAPKSLTCSTIQVWDGGGLYAHIIQLARRRLCTDNIVIIIFQRLMQAQR